MQRFISYQSVFKTSNDDKLGEVQV